METDQTLDERRSQLSKDLLRRVPRLLASTPLPFVNADGRSPVIVALTEDTCGQVFEWAAQTGGANVFTEYKDRILSVCLDPSQGTSDGGDEDSSKDSDLLEVHENAEFGMLIAALDRDPDAAVTITLAKGTLIKVPKPRELQAA